MTIEQFRKAALRLPEATEAAHMRHPDFRVGGKIFATLGYPEEGFATLLLEPDEQKQLIANHPDAFAPAAGAWGKRGSTQVRLQSADRAVVRDGLLAAYRAKAPARLRKMLEQ